jgi:hypothetical protein
VLGQYDLVATDIPVRGVNLCNKLLMESSVSDVTSVGMASAVDALPAS